MTTKPEVSEQETCARSVLKAFDIEAASRTLEALLKRIDKTDDQTELRRCAISLVGGLRAVIAALETERAEHVQELNKLTKWLVGALWTLPDELKTGELREAVEHCEKEHAQATEAACRAQREKDAKVCRALISTDTDWDTSYWNQAVDRCAHRIEQSPLSASAYTEGVFVTEQHDGEKG